MDRAMYRGSLAFYWAAQLWEITSKEEIKQPLGVLPLASCWVLSLAISNWKLGHTGQLPGAESRQKEMESISGRTNGRNSQ